MRTYHEELLDIPLYDTQECRQCQDSKIRHVFLLIFLHMFSGKNEIQYTNNFVFKNSQLYILPNKFS